METKKRAIISLGNKSNITMEEAFEKFAFYKKTLVREERMDYYKVCFKYFSEFYSPGKLCKDISQETISNYRDYLPESVTA